MTQTSVVAIPKARARSSQLDRTLLSLRELVLEGAFATGERIPEIPLAARLGVSRTPLRLALEQLAHEGIVEVSSSGGFLARGFTIRDINDAIELRGTLEGHAARLAAERITHPNELDTMRVCSDKISQLVRSSNHSVQLLIDYVELNATFHAQLIKLAKSPMLIRSFEHVVSLPFASPSAFVELQGHLEQSREILFIAQEHHRAILDAIEERDSGRAEQLAREHSRLARRNLEIALADQTLLHLVPGSSLIQVVPEQKRKTSPKPERQIDAV